GSLTPQFMIDELTANPSLLLGFELSGERGRFVEGLIYSMEKTNGAVAASSLVGLGIALIQSPEGLMPLEVFERLRNTIDTMVARGEAYPYTHSYQLWTWQMLYKAHDNVSPEVLIKGITDVTGRLIQSGSRVSQRRILIDQDMLIRRLALYYTSRQDYASAAKLIPYTANAGLTARAYEQCLESAPDRAAVDALGPGDGWADDPDVVTVFKTARLLHSPGATL